MQRATYCLEDSFIEYSNIIWIQRDILREDITDTIGTEVILILTLNMDLSATHDFDFGARS